MIPYWLIKRSNKVKHFFPIYLIIMFATRKSLFFTFLYTIFGYHVRNVNLFFFIYNFLVIMNEMWIYISYYTKIYNLFDHPVRYADSFFIFNLFDHHVHNTDSLSRLRFYVMEFSKTLTSFCDTQRNFTKRTSKSRTVFFEFRAAQLTPSIIYVLYWHVYSNIRRTNFFWS